MEQRYQAVLAVIQDGWKVTEVAERLGVARQSVHNWIACYEAGGLAALADKSHRPATSAHQISPELEALICEIRRKHPGWGTAPDRKKWSKRARNSDKRKPSLTSGKALTGRDSFPHHSPLQRRGRRFEPVTAHQIRHDHDHPATRAESWAMATRKCWWSGMILLVHDHRVCGAEVIAGSVEEVHVQEQFCPGRCSPFTHYLADQTHCDTKLICELRSRACSPVSSSPDRV
jgi:transposase